MEISESQKQQWRDFADRCTGRGETGSLNYREFAILVRNAALEEAKQACDQFDPRPDQWSDMSEFTERRVVRNCNKAIEKLKYD